MSIKLRTIWLFVGYVAVVISLTLGAVSTRRSMLHEDTVEFFNLVLQLKLSAEEQQDLVAYMRTH